MKTIIVIAAMLAALPAHAKPLECVLWPRSEACRPPPPQIIVAPEPAPAPPAAAPVSPPAPAVTPQPPAAKPATAAPRPRAKPIKSNPIIAKQSKQARACNQGPDLPYSCEKVRDHAAGKTPAQLKLIEATGRLLGYPPLTCKQRKQAAACQKG